jgi:molybdopterin-guanine dinucleotide biosynthesis protein A
VSVAGVPDSGPGRRGVGRPGREGPVAAVLGAVLAGGASRRYGTPKAFATVGGERIVDRVLRALGAVVDRVGIVANDLAAYAPLGYPVRPDARPGAGALGGIYTAVAWAREEGCRGALCVACDMPFVAPELLRELVRDARPDDVVVPASGSRRGLEPLCAYYGVGCLGPIERALDRGDRAIVAFFPEVRVRRLEPAIVSRFGPPERLFFNVNTPEDRERAERWASEERR